MDYFFITKVFLTQPQSYRTFPWVQLQTLRRGCLLQITIFILRHTSYLVHLHPCLGLVLFMLRLCDPFFIFSLIFITINHTTSLKQTNLFFAHFSEYLMLVLDNMNEESVWFSNSKNSASGCLLLRFYLIFCLFRPGVSFMSCLYKKACIIFLNKQQPNFFVTILLSFYFSVSFDFMKSAVLLFEKSEFLTF